MLSARVFSLREKILSPAQAPLGMRRGEEDVVHWMGEGEGEMGREGKDGGDRWQGRGMGKAVGRRGKAEE